MVLGDITNFANAGALSPFQSSSKKQVLSDFYPSPSFTPNKFAAPRRILETEFVSSPARSPALLDIAGVAAPQVPPSPIVGLNSRLDSHEQPATLVLEPRSPTLAPSVQGFGPSADQLRRFSVEPRTPLLSLASLCSSGPLTRRLSLDRRLSGGGSGRSLPPRFSRRSSLGCLPPQERLCALGGVPERRSCAQPRPSPGQSQRSTTVPPAPTYRGTPLAATPVSPRRQPGTPPRQCPGMSGSKIPRAATHLARTPRTSGPNLTSSTPTALRVPTSWARTPRSVPPNSARRPKPNAITRAKTPQPPRCRNASPVASERRCPTTAAETRRLATARADVPHAGKGGPEKRGQCCGLGIRSATAVKGGKFKF